ncbi:MAG: hypothetical protein KBT33_03995 [Prevotellaceae bacterium]|nr:hypothetical protein [Candidatus Minthosoma equi]
MTKNNTYILRLIIFLTIAVTGMSEAWGQDTKWDGTTKTAPDMATNNGTSETLAIQITNAEELAWLGDQMRLGNTATGKTYGNKYWILMNDIDLGGKSDFTGNDWASMIGHTGNAFCGYFDGNNKTISNIQVAAVTSKMYYGLFPSIQGKSTTDLSTVNNLNINGVYLQATAANMAANTRLGGLAGYVKQANITNVAVSNVNFTYTNTITNTNQLGGAIGCMENNTTLDNVDVTGVTATFSNTTTGLYVGGIVGASKGTANTNSMTYCDAKTVQVTHTSNITGTTYMGGLVGDANTSLNVINNNTVAGVEGKNGGKGFDVSISGTVSTFDAGGLLGYTTGGTHEIKNNAVSDIHITVGGDTKGGSIYLAGLVGYAKGSGSPSTRILMQGNTTEKAHVTMNGEVGHALYMGGFLGYADEHVNVYNNKVTTPNISITNNVNNETYVGGAVGRQNKNTIIDGMTVSGGSISGPSEKKTVINNKVFFVGGFIGQQNSSGATPAYVTNVFRNIAVSDININLGKYEPAGVINNHKFAVGGIAGSVNAPNKDANGLCGMPENIIFKGGSIYAPYAATSPTVPNFNSGTAAHNNLTTEAVTTIDALDKAKVKTWYYSDYELGLSSEFLNCTKVKDNDATPTTDTYRKNYTVTPTETGGISYITVNNSTFEKQNRYQDNDRDSWTVLWWTTQNSWAAGGPTAALFTNEEQPIYPQSNFGTVGTAELTKFPYYMYFYQGVANANYVEDAVATKIIKGIEGNMTEAAKSAPITLTISNNKENERGFAQRTISVKAVSNETDVTGSYTYQWYVNGKADGTGTTKTLTPHWRDGQGITVNALNGETVVATATYTLAPGVLHTKKSIADASAEKVRSDINGRGTKANPYIIDSETALRQWSYLSTAQTGTRWEDIAMPVDPMTNKASTLVYCHYNRAYYELGSDITMSNDAFVPISHVGYGSDGTWGSYSNNFIFQGNFDGKGHKISGLKITWGAGQYNGNKANIYHGLFGAVGHSTATAKWGDGTTTSNTVIQNLVIDNAKLTHDTQNSTFSYKKSYSHITADNYNNCMVGVLAGIVAANTTVQNIEIRGSKITDEGSSDYSLATMGLFVGGAIGSVQAQYNNENIPTNTIIKNIVVGTNIDLTHAKIQDVAIAQQGAYNVGGIIGRFASTNGNLTATQAVMPKYLLYTGSIKATSNTEGKKDAMISPVIAATRYSTNQTINLSNISKIWEGNNNGAEQLTVADALYYNFHISDASGNMHLVTEDYPNNVCGNGARAQDTHTDGNETAAGYLAQRYQGVNYNARYIDENTYSGDADGGKRMAVAILNSHDDITMFWEWKSGDKTPHMTETRTEGAYIVRDADTADKYNVVGPAATAGKYYKWYVDGVLQNNEHSSSITISADISDSNIKAEVYDDSSAPDPIATTQYLVIKGEFKVNTSISKDGDTYTVGITRGGVDLTTDNLNNRIAVSYQWYKGNAVNVNTATALSSTTKSITITKDQLGEVNNLFCHVVITTTGTDPKELFKGDISQYVRDATVVYLQYNDVTVKVDGEDKTYSKTNAGANSTSTTDSYGVKKVDYNANTTTYGKTPDNPVNSWAEAYALLNGYTEPTEAYITEYNTAHGTSFTTTNYDFSDEYNDGKGDYPYDVYKRDNFKRKVKPIEECTNNWENNIIVLMGLSTDEYFNKSETTMHTIDGKIANKPVTITGQWDGGTNYYGYLSNSSGDFSINADHKFENMGIGVLDKDISATASIRYRIYAHRWNVHAGKGLLMGWAAALEWGIEQTDANKKIYKITSADVSTGTPVGQYACDIAIMGGYLNDNTSMNPEMFEYINHGRDDIGQQIKIESGFWGPVCPGNRQTDSGNTINTYYTMGGPDHPAKTTITVDIDREWNDGINRNKFNSAMSPATVDIGCILTGNHEGTMYADVTLDILSGNMGRIVNGIKGAQRRQIKNPGSFTTNGVYRHTVKYGETWTPIAAPAPDSYFGRGVLNFDPSRTVNNNNVNKNERISVIELYCGGLGRGHNDGSYHPEVRSYFYGLSEVNIKGGTFYKTIYGSGAGGVNGIGTDKHHTDDDGIPYWNTKHETADANGKTPHVWYAPYEYIKKENSFNFVKIKVADNNSEDENLTSDGYVDLEKTRNIINITGGIFGSESKPVSIYAGGNGEADAALINPSSTKVGDVKNTYNTPNHQAGNMYGSTEGLTTQINISGDAKIYGSIYGGGKGSMRYYRYFLRAANEIVAYTTDNQEYTRIWNPKSSSNGDYNQNGGTDWNNIINSRKNADRYLNLGQVYGNSKVTISGNVEIFGNVYGGGEGVKDVTVDQLFSETDSEFGLSNQLSSKDAIIAYAGTATNRKRTAHVDWTKDNFVSFPNMGKIFGKAGVDISGDVTIHGNVYGGGQSGSIEGTTGVDIKGNVNIYGRVYGAGQGLEVDAAKDYKQIATIIGNATVNLSENATIWQDMFGGGQNAVVDGNTYFNMSGGHVAANVFGGGEGYVKKDAQGNYVKVNDKLVITSADVSGNTNVDITDGEIIWNRTSMEETAFGGMITIHTFTKNLGTVSDPIIDTKTYTDSELQALEKTLDQMKIELAGYEYTFVQEENHLAKGEIVWWNPNNQSLADNTVVDGKKYYNSKFYDEDKKTFKIEHNIFGGGHIACIVGTYNEGVLAENTGLATVSLTKGLFGDSLTTTNQWKDSFKDDTHPHFYVFGGGKGEHTKVGNSDVTVNIEGEYGDYTYEVEDPTEQLAKPRRALAAKPDGKLPVFDNTYGIPGFTVLGVLGGGYAGTVHNDTKVTVDGKTFLRRIYGGGFGDQESIANNTTGQVGHDTDVHVNGAHTYGDVFGGGAGVASKTVDLYNVARVLGKTSVTIADDANIYGKVYGGGDMACVGVAGTKNYTSSVSSASSKSSNIWTYSHSNHQTFVNILGGNIYGEVYGGGKGVKNGEANDYTKVGRIEGNTLVHIANSVYDEENDIWDVVPEATTDATVPNVWSRIYGGCAYGTVDGNTMVHTEGGMLGLNIFGGGYGDVVIQNDQTDSSSGASTASATLDQVLGRKATGDDNVTYANILGNTKVQIDGGSWIWNRKADTNGNITTWEDANKEITNGMDGFKELVAKILQVQSVADLEEIEAVKSISPDFFNLTTRQFFKNHNIFGGGNRACFVGTYSDADASSSVTPAASTGTSEVIINHSPIAVIKDDSGNDINMLNPSTVAGLCWYLGINNVSHPQFSVFGAGYGANTKVGNAIVKAQPGVQLDASGGLMHPDSPKYLNEESDLYAYLAFDSQIAESWESVTTDDKKKYYGYAGTNEGNTYMRYHASQLAWSLGAPNFTFMDIHGGGFSGYVVNDTKVETDCQLTVRNIFGAGLGYKPYGLTAETTQTAANAFNFGQVGRNSDVFIKSGIVSLNVYGGGAGVESYYVSDDATTKTDFPNIALVKGKTNVDVYGETIKIDENFPYAQALAGKRLERTIIFGSIYGGGDVANVGSAAKDATVLTGADSETFTSTVNIRGGAIQSQIYAGGNGRQADQCSITGDLPSPTYGYRNLGAVFGNTHLVVADADWDYPYSLPKGESQGGASPHIWNRIYGGCQNGTVYGNTLVEVNGGSIGHNIFGGGFGDDGTNLGHSTGDDEDEDASKMMGRANTIITSADVTGNTNIFINGGEMELTSYWHPDTRTWEPATITAQGQTYSPQYDVIARKFKINHNIFGGGNAACTVGGNTYVTLNKGMLKDKTPTVPGETTDKFFESNEWKEVYQKVGSPHFAVFGGGYGENTLITKDTHLDIKMKVSDGTDISSIPEIEEDKEYEHFLGERAVMDIVGGGYSGKVAGDTHVTVTEDVFARRVFGGGFYNTVHTSNIHLKSIDCYDVFGGGLMGDVEVATNVNIGEYKSGSTNKNIFIHGNVFGGNDVSGYINMNLDEGGYFKEESNEGGTNIRIYGGRIDHNVYGAGNGDYLYALDREGHDKVTVNEHYPLDPDDANSPEYDLVYTVPMRETMPSAKAASDAAKIVNINSWRPLTNRVNIEIKGYSDSANDPVTIKGDVYGGGNSATVQKVYASGTTNMTGDVTFNIGSHVNIGRVFMGCNGDALFTASEDNAYLTDFQKLNNLQLDDPIDWETDPSNHGISTLYLPTENEHRPLIYPHLLDLYFQPVEMNIQANLKWAGKDERVDPLTDLTNCTIGTFCCGGNRGNMNVYPETTGAKQGNVLDYLFPENLTITEKIIGGCNNANYEWFNSEKNTKIFHEGGYLLGEGHSPYPFIKITIKNKFNPAVVNGAYKGGNVYGGCYETGTVRGDITVDMKSDMLAGKSKATLEKSNELLATDPKYAALNVYGAGYGMESYVYGDTNVKFGEGVVCSQPGAENNFNATGVSANFVYGGGQQGNVIGVTNVDILNGHVFKSVTGGSYSGYVYGSTQIKVGYPTVYTLKPGNAGRYLLNRTDVNNTDIVNTDAEGNTTPVIKQYINLIPGDAITEGVYEAIYAKYNGENVDATDISTTKSDYFASDTKTPSVGWDNINIFIDEACYGGGYSLAQGSSVMANNTTVLKYTDDYNINNVYKSGALADLVGGNHKGTSAGFGGNTMMLIADQTNANGTPASREHISISHQEMKEVVLPTGTDLFGYYYKEPADKGGNYRYIYQAGTYTYGGTMPEGADDNKVYEYDGEGGVFGDGHLSYAEGFRAADLTGYGYAQHAPNSAKILNTFQRMDILRLKDNCLVLLGARDYATNATNKTPYSISRVGEIQMRSSINDKVALPKETSTVDNKTNYTYGYRNYMGLSNNIHYVGAIESDVKFNDATNFPWHDANGGLGTGNFAASYEKVKQDYIDHYYSDSHADKGNNTIFQKRNDGTAKNMIGIASGYALKIQNVYETIENNKVKDNLYYGPIYGVVQMRLVDVRQDEGGGYVYADNVHKRTPANTKTAADFLEATGNFVFPYSEMAGKYIVDDCFPSGYDQTKAGNGDATEEIHYWYVTGFNYYYNVHITGYTYDSSTDPIIFNSDNSDGLTVLSGLMEGQTPTIYSWKMRSGHPTDKSYSCDLESRNYDPDAKDNSGINLQRGSDGNYQHAYNLYFSGSNNTTYDQTGVYYSLPMNEALSKELSNKKMTGTLPELTGGDAKISFQLTDQADNTTSAYYNQHLKEPCYATLVLRAPYIKSVGDTQENGYIGIQYYYTKSGSGTQESPYTYTVVPDATKSLTATTDYYYYDSSIGEYIQIDFSKMYVKNGEEYSSVAKNEMSINGTTNYYFMAPRWYTYTIYLTIDYVQGPNIDGSITVENCALPGEMVRVNKKNVNIHADESFSADGYYWRIGKREKDSNGKWKFVDETTWTKDVATSNSAVGYDTYIQTEDAATKGKGFFQGSNYNKTGDYLDIPAYYYMNGYGIQLGISMTGLDQIFPVAMTDADQFVVHNYHRMKPRGAANVNLHLAEAVARAKAEPTELAQPRIYINDTEDLAGFVAFLDTIGTGKSDNNTTGHIVDGKEYVKLGAKQDNSSWIANLCEVPRYGEYAQFVVQNNMNVPAQYNPASIFKGTLHGNGHVFTDLAENKHIFTTNNGNIYNLGLASGNIASSNAAVGEGTDGTYHCCFEYNDGDSPIVYRMDGSSDNTYTVDDFRYGKVAYDLNQYYLDARYSIGASTSSDASYVENYFANGDYQYARQADRITGAVPGITYLRTGQLNAEPNYGSNETRHDKTHTIDKARAKDYVAALPAVDEVSHAATEADVTEGKAEKVGDKVIDTPASPAVPESRTGNYLPLFNSPQYEDLGLTEPMNDYLFWGQNLQQTPAAYPATIESHQNSAMTNRVYRAAGYYRTTQLDGYYYNAYNMYSGKMGTYVHNPKTTAIDFTCQADNETTDLSTYKEGLQTAANGRGAKTGGSIFYSPVADNATSFASFTVDNGITKNLLVYTPNADDETTNCYSVVNSTLKYDESTPEANIKGHHVVENGSLSTSYLHLVERAEESSPNNDFCNPIDFTATNRAWYTRKPLYYAKSNNDAWEGICLPFTVDKVEASLNGEITHFYGTPTTDEVSDPNTNYHTLHHEYWLRGLIAVGTEDAKTVGTFMRPGSETGLFAATDATTVSYAFNNDFFKDTYASHFYNYDHATDGDWYLSSHTYPDYLPLTQGTPYIVSFPGYRFYEFDLSSQFYNEMLKKYGSAQAPAQTVTFNATDNVDIPVTKAIETTANGYVHTGTFLATEKSESIYSMNATGTEFDKDYANVLPFRTYMTKAPGGGAKTRSFADTYIYIGGETTGIDTIQPEIDSPDQDNTEDSGDYLKAYPIGKGRINIESTYSTTLMVYTSAGQLYRVIEVRPGTETYSGFHPGIYIVGKQKLLIK